MKIGLIDVDGHNYPNLALMKISAYHKAKGDSVEWWWGWEHYDIVYMSKVFSETYSPHIPVPVNADMVIRGGSGYAIQTIDGIEIYDREKDRSYKLVSSQNCVPETAFNEFMATKHRFNKAKGVFFKLRRRSKRVRY